MTNERVPPLTVNRLPPLRTVALKLGAVLARARKIVVVLDDGTEYALNEYEVDALLYGREDLGITTKEVSP